MGKYCFACMWCTCYQYNHVSPTLHLPFFCPFYHGDDSRYAQNNASLSRESTLCKVHGWNLWSLACYHWSWREKNRVCPRGIFLVWYVMCEWSTLFYMCQDTTWETCVIWHDTQMFKRKNRMLHFRFRPWPMQHQMFYRFFWKQILWFSMFSRWPAAIVHLIWRSRGRKWYRGW